jgi:hypothetical protein
MPPLEFLCVLTITGLALVGATTQAAPTDFLPGNRVLLDAHNCYPYEGQWADRIVRALGTGTPLAIEPDLDWYQDPGSGEWLAVVSHGQPYTGEEPSLEEYFFETLRPIVEAALAAGPADDWPLITLNIDFKNSSIEHVEAVATVFNKYRDWISSAEKSADSSEVSPIIVRPIMILLSGNGGQQEVLYDRVPVGEQFLAFGAARQNSIPNAGASRAERLKAQASIAPEQLLTEPASNFRRWWNNSWYVIEEGGAPGGGDWTPAEQARLQAFVDHAHGLGYWIRFYTLNGHGPDSNRGWSAGYNFGSTAAADLRWRAAIDAGVDFVATDMYEAFAQVLREAR